jgi:hypothetical protein
MPPTLCPALRLERLLHEIHGVQFHPVQAKRQQRMSGRLALGLPPIEHAATSRNLQAT